MVTKSFLLWVTNHPLQKCRVGEDCLVWHFPQRAEALSWLRATASHFFSHATKNSNMVAMELVMAINPTCLFFFFFFIGNAHITDSLPTPAFIIIESGIGAWPRLPRPWCGEPETLIQLHLLPCFFFFFFFFEKHTHTYIGEERWDDRSGSYDKNGNCVY